ncbi:zinc-binding dehydrogenase, partial [Phenylobacterium sp.]|uniref:zinc-binding dehydrogenase n=1 Tax=Phenylobacterium sp. TaxID=1871053 RepID=UPI002EDB1D05
LSRLGYRVVASTGRPQEQAYLVALGAAEIIDRATLSAPARGPIGAERWACVIDSVGSHTLANALAQTKYRGVVTACGLAQGVDLPATVLPFILRNVTLAGIDSVNAPRAVREEAWSRLARDLDLARLESTVTEVGLADVPQIAQAVLRGEVRGRTLVDVRR